MREEDKLEISQDDGHNSSASEQDIGDLQEAIKKPKIPAWLPDWKQTEGYPDPKGQVSREQWAWEFIRRNPRYQYLYRIGKRHKESWYKTFPNSVRFSRYFKCDPKVNKGESYNQYMARCKLKEVSPEITPKRQKILNVFPVVEFSKKIDPANPKPPQFNKYHKYPIIDTVSVDEENFYNSMNDLDKVFMTFSVALPILDQITNANAYLIEQQNNYKAGKNMVIYKGRVNFTPLRNYLRYLDGKISGATQVEIARVVHPEEDETSNKQKVNKGLKTAEYYRDIGYIKILLE